MFSSFGVICRDLGLKGTTASLFFRGKGLTFECRAPALVILIDQIKLFSRKPMCSTHFWGNNQRSKMIIFISCNWSNACLVFLPPEVGVSSTSSPLACRLGNVGHLSAGDSGALGVQFNPSLKAWGLGEQRCKSRSTGKSLISDIAAQQRIQIVPSSVFRPSVDWMRPTHTEGTNLLYWVHWFKC